MRKIFIFIASLISLSFNRAPGNEKQVVFDRLAAIYRLHAIVIQQTWAQDQYSKIKVPLIYYTPTVSYIANPTEKFVQQFHPVLIHAEGNVSLYLLSNRFDNAPFHMEVSITSGADSSAFDYNDPYIKCSSFEDAEKMIPALTFAAWQSMIVHECFHAFQYKHKAYVLNAVATNTINAALGDSLQQLYAVNGWYKQSIDQENTMLLTAIKSHNKQSLYANADSFLVLREHRRKLAAQNLHLQVENAETSFETLEGTARYIEAATLKAASKNNPAWLYETTISDRYFYATGYNICLLLDKLGTPYKRTLFRNGSLTLEDILKQVLTLRHQQPG